MCVYTLDSTYVLAHAKYILCYWVKTSSPYNIFKKKWVKQYFAQCYKCLNLSSFKTNLLMYKDMWHSFLHMCSYVWLFVHFYLPVCRWPCYCLLQKAPVFLYLLMLELQVSPHTHLHLCGFERPELWLSHLPSLWFVELYFSDMCVCVGAHVYLCTHSWIVI